MSHIVNYRVRPFENDNPCAKIYKCPSLPNCDWTGPVYDLKPHFQANHPYLWIYKAYDDIRYNVKWMEFSAFLEDSEQNLLLIYKKDAFLLQLKIELESEQFWCGVRYLGNAESAEKFRFYVIMTSNETKQKTIRKCGKMQTDIDWHFDTKAMLSFDLKCVKVEMGNCFVNICGPENPIELYADELKCVICENNPIVPVFMCQNNHVVCNDCKNTDGKCNICDLTPADVTNRVRFPCKNEEIGCTMADIPEELKKHERKCFEMTSCFADQNCAFTGLARKWWYHLGQRHPEMTYYYYKNGLSYDLKTPFTVTHFMRRYGTVFKICCQFDGNFVWTFQQVGLNAEEQRLFQLKIYVKNSLAPRIKKSFSMICSPLMHYDEEANDSLTVGYYTLQPFFLHKKLSLNYCLSKLYD